MVQTANIVFAFLIYVSATLLNVNGHGRLINPPGRSSLWRFKRNPLIAPHADKIKRNSNDDNLNCGGLETLLNNGGKCGLCGDPFNARVKDNEAGGKYALGIISKEYEQGQVINVTVVMTIGHPGFFEFRLCPWNNPKTPITQKCLNRHLLRQPNGKSRWQLPSTATGSYHVSLQLPKDVTCTQCVLQWKHRFGTSKIEREYYGCSDVAIQSASSPAKRRTTTRRPPSTRRPAARRTTTRRTTTRRTTTKQIFPDPAGKRTANCKRRDYRMKCLGCRKFYICASRNRPIERSCRRGTTCQERRGRGRCVSGTAPNC